MASLGFCKNRFSFHVLQRKHDRTLVMRKELARCGFVPTEDLPMKRPVFGLHSRMPGPQNVDARLNDFNTAHKVAPHSPPDLEDRGGALRP